MKATGYVFLDDKQRWVARTKTPDGKDTRKILGHAAEGFPLGGATCTKERAEEMLAEILAPWRDWTDDSDPTFSQAAEEYLSDLRAKGKRETTLREYQRITTQMWRQALAQMPLSKIREDDMVTLHKHTSVGCVNQTKTVLAGIVKVARKRHKYSGPDFSEWFERAPVKRKLEIEVYTPAEVEKIASFAEPEIAAIIRVAAYTGLRMSELRALTWEDVDFTGEKITVRRRYTDTDEIQAPKSGKARTVPMAKQVADTLRERWTVAATRDTSQPHPGVPNVLVFGVGADGFRSYEYIYEGFRSACRQSAIRCLRFHDLRHTFASTMIQRFPLPTVQEWCGHADIKTTARYLHWVPRKDDAQRMSDLLGGTDG